MRHFIFALGILVAGCSSGSDAPQASLLNSDGTFITPLVESAGAVVRQTGTNNGYAFQVGFNQNRSGFETQAVLFDNISLPAPTAGGTTQMTGTYQLETFQNPVTNGTDLTGTRLSRARDITMTVDFDANTITGSDAGLALDGTFTNRGTLTGTASLDGMNGDLSGVVSNDVSIAVFDGQSATGVFAGGLLVER